MENYLGLFPVIAGTRFAAHSLGDGSLLKRRDTSANRTGEIHDQENT